MTRTPGSTSSMDSVYSSERMAHSSFNALNQKASPPVSRSHEHHGSDGNLLLRPPSGAGANHRRVVSMPDTSHHGPHSPADWGYSSSSDSSTDRNFGTASPPIFDFTAFEDRYRNSGSAGLHNSFLAVTPSAKDGRRVVSDQGAGYKSQSVGDSSTIPMSTSWPDVDMIFETLEDVLAEDAARWAFDLEGLLDSRQQQALPDTLRPVKPSRKLTVFGRPLSDVVQYASKAIFFGNGLTGATLLLPLVVVSCVEELYRTGIYQPNLFRNLPNRRRLLDLISMFDSVDRPSSIKCNTRQDSTCKEQFGANISLQLESTADICALFASYLSAQPESLMPAYMFDAIWVLCRLEVTPLISKDHSFETDATRQTPTILLAQLLLHLLPPPNFSLLTYLLAFFSQTVLANEENGVDIRDLAKMFGARLFGNGTSSIASGSNSTGDGQDSSAMLPTRGETMMAWFLRRWSSIFDSLFEVVEDAKMGVYKRNKMLRKDSLGRPALQQRREKALKKRCSQLVKVPSEGDTTGTPKTPTKARLRPQKATTLDAPSLRESLATFQFPVAVSPELRSQDEEISPTTVVTLGLHDIGIDQKMGPKEELELRGHSKAAPVPFSRFYSESRVSGRHSSYATSQNRSVDDDYFSYDQEPAQRLSTPSTCPSERSDRYKSQTELENPLKESLSLCSSRSESIRDRLDYSEEDLEDKYVNRALGSAEGSSILQLNAKSRDLLDELLLEVTLPTFPSSPHLALDSSASLSRQKAIRNVKTPNRRSTIDSSAVSDSSKKFSLQPSRGCSHIPLSSMRRTLSKTEEVGRTPEPLHRDIAATKDEEIRKLRSRVRKVEKERDEALQVLGEVHKVLGAM